jgi:orotate phosphoribosyltransferase
MTFATLTNWNARQRLAGLATQYLLTSLGQTKDCLEESSLIEIADSSFESIPGPVRHHIRRCPRCASQYSAFRGAHVVSDLPARWSVSLTLAEMNEQSTCGTVEFQVLGFVSLEQRVFEECSTEDEWVTSPLRIRVNISIDSETDFLGLTLLDLPSNIAAVSLRLPTGHLSLESLEGHDLCELMLIGPEWESARARGVNLTAVIDALSKGEASIVFDMAAETPSSGDHPDAILELLQSSGAIEREFDYILPSGLHADTHVNLGTICRSEESLCQIAAAFDLLFFDVDFDTIVTNGWAMATIARRLALMRSTRWGKMTIHDVMSEGYDKPVLTSDIGLGKSLILIDVCVTGSLIEKLTGIIRQGGAKVAGTGCVVRAAWKDMAIDHAIRTLTNVQMDIVDPGREKCSRCKQLPRRVFNPFSHSMTEKAPTGRSPSEFLLEHAEALEFWREVNTTHAYEHHRKEGNTHYLSFIDTAKLISDPVVGPSLIERFRNIVAKDAWMPTAILAPQRTRAILLAQKLIESISKACPGTTVSLMIAQRGIRGRAWRLRPEDRVNLHGAKVLIIDSAAGHGKTLDHLALMAESCAPASIRAAVLLSRLTDGCEAAFSARLSGGFQKLYQLPVRPIVIRGTSVDICPVCQRNEALREVASQSSVASLIRWAENLRKRPVTTTKNRIEHAPPERQLTLFPRSEPAFLEICRPAIASGVTLHALNAARTNGMAPLRLPELTDQHIPYRNRAAMVENLPTGVIAWSEGFLDHDLEAVLSNSENASIWKASVDILSREGRGDWLEHLDGLISRLPKAPSQTFWAHVACCAYLVAREDPDRAPEIRERVEHLVKAHEENVRAGMLQPILDELEK